ncbi:hypothetical protein SPLC1_S380140 [Arthrospira platensis C1]|nr:hypothetical protein SPLC1_S380140 [Arthrospira platensis C1]
MRFGNRSVIFETIAKNSVEIWEKSPISAWWTNSHGDAR